MTNRNIFTHKAPYRSTWADCLVAVLVGLALAVGALEYFDILMP